MTIEGERVFPVYWLLEVVGQRYVGTTGPGLTSSNHDGSKGTSSLKAEEE